MVSELDLQLHKQLTGEVTDASNSTQIINKILSGVEVLKAYKLIHIEVDLSLNNFSKELRRLKVALIYYRESRVYDDTSSSTEELFEIMDESLTNINVNLNNIITKIRRHIDESDLRVLASARFIQKGLVFFLVLFTLGTITVFYVFDMFLSANLKKLINGTIQLGDGNLEWRFKSSFDDEFGKLGKAFNDMAGKIADSKQEILSQSEELTERNKQLKQEEQRAQNYLDVAGAMMAALNLNGEITLINKQGCNILNVSEKEAIGTNWFDRFLPEEIKGEVKGVFNQLMAGDIDPVEFYENIVLTSDGIERTIAFHNTLLKNEQGEIEGVFFSGEDVTLQKQAESEQEKLKEQLRQVQKMEAVGTMAGGIAHDFNNILTAILGYAELIKNDTPAESTQIQEDIDQILKAGNRAKELVGQILAFSRKEKMELLPMHPHVIIKETLKLLRSTTPTTVSIIQSISEDCGMIKADPTALHQILINLFTNALHAMDDKGVVTVNLLEVNFKGQPLWYRPGLSPGTYVRLSVSDTGDGMDQNTIDRIFDPFFTTKEVGKGTGMGLSVVYGIVESHGGFIDVDSEPGQGSTFSVFFPVTEAEAEDISEVEPISQLKTGKGQILLVDDEETLLVLAERIIKSLGYDVIAENNSAKALEKFKSDPDQFDLILTDLAMPHMSGTELRAEILKIRPDIPVIICTGYDSKITAEYAGEKGITEYIKKPYSKKILSEAIREALNGKV